MDEAGTTRDAQISAVAALDEPIRRWLYDYVVGQPDPVSRDQAAAALAVPRSTAAFHLDHLVDKELLEVIYQRRTGRTGPGAGRPAKLYRRSNQHVDISLPDRRYDLAGRLLCSALEQAEHSGNSPRATLHQRAYELGEQLGATAHATARGSDARDTVLRALQAYGYEPRTEDHAIVLANCPFHALAQDHTELVCGMNLHLVRGLLDSFAPTGLTALLRLSAGRCCVRVEQDHPATGSDPSRTGRGRWRPA
jgi:predicted ArsR family transcriptional regulator